MKNLEEYIEKAKTLENSSPLLTLNDLSAMIDAKDAAPPASAGASNLKDWRRFVLPTFSAIMVLIAVLSSVNRLKVPLADTPEDFVKFEKPINKEPESSDNSAIAAKDSDDDEITVRGRKSDPISSNDSRLSQEGNQDIAQSRQKTENETERRVNNATDKPNKNITYNESASAPNETQRSESKFDMDGFRAEQRSMLDSLLASRFSKIDSLLALQPRETHRVDTLVIKEIIMKDPLNVDFRHSLTANFWLFKDNIYEVQWEFAPYERWSFTVKGGYGSLLGKDKVFRTNTGIEQKSPYKLLILGSKITHYLFGDFDHGVQVGIDATYYATSYNVARAAGPYGEGRGFNAVPFAGYKVILAPGYTLNVQGGYGMKYHNIFEGYRDGNGVYQGYIKSQFKPTYIFNVNFGWSL